MLGKSILKVFRKDWLVKEIFNMKTLIDKTYGEEQFQIKENLELELFFYINGELIGKLDSNDFIDGHIYSMIPDYVKDLFPESSIEFSKDAIEFVKQWVW